MSKAAAGNEKFRKNAAKFLPNARAITEIHLLCQFNLTSFEWLA
jgi:hypothetical protein